MANDNLIYVEEGTLRKVQIRPEHIEGESLYQKIADVKHLRDLINAEDEGRLIVLPCKPGKEVYIVNELCSDIWDDRACVVGPYNVRHPCEKGFFYESMAIGMCFMRWDSVGKTAFWNKDEAYAAMNKLKQEKGENDG